jgi:hypothetical protein
MAPEMRYVVLNSANRSGTMARKAETRFVAEQPSKLAPADLVDDKERDSGITVRKAAAGRDHRPSTVRTTTPRSISDEARQSHAESLDLDRLASQVYGRIKRQLTVERERRGFIA